MQIAEYNKEVMMADGTFAVLMFLLGLTDMQNNYCNTEAGCFDRTEVLPRLYVSGGDIIKRRAEAGSEGYIRYDLGHRNGPFGHAAGISMSSRDALWAGVGQTYIASIDKSPVMVELHAMTGLYSVGNGHDLGGLIAFRSGVDLVYETGGGVRYALSYDHRSHMGIYPDNPGVESVQLAVSWPLE
jgi:lipid A 3-O-deacylase